MIFADLFRGPIHSSFKLHFYLPILRIGLKIQIFAGFREIHISEREITNRF